MMPALNALASLVELGLGLLPSLVLSHPDHAAEFGRR
jgi:hypothetical protein